MVIRSYCKVIHLSFEENPFSIDNSRIEARLVCCRFEIVFLNNHVRVAFPEAGGLRMSLHGSQDWDNIPSGEWWAFHLVYPPVVKCLVGAYIKALLRWRCFAECIRYVRTNCGKSFAWRRLSTPWLFPWR